VKYNQKNDIIDSIELLRSLEKAIKDPSGILTKRIKNSLTGTLQREALTALLIAIVLNYNRSIHMEWHVCRNSEEDEHDGVLVGYDHAEKSRTRFELEQVMLTVDDQNLQDYSTPKEAIIEKIRQKHNKNYANPSNIILVIFLDISQDSVTPADIKEFLRTEYHFGFYILIMLNDKTLVSEEYIYTVVDLDPEREGHSRFNIKITQDFSNYNVYV
jgi:hypothetical protein